MSGITEFAARGAKPADKAYRIKDEHGLYLEVRPSGMKSWRLRYYFNKKPGIVTLGEYPLITIREARKKRDEIRKKIMEGISPAAQEEEPAKAMSFREAAEEWLSEQIKNGARDAKYIEVTKGRLNNYILPEFGEKPIADVTPLDLLRLAQKVRDFGHSDTARRLIYICGQVFRYAALLGLVTQDPTYALRGALPPLEGKHFASIQDAATLGRFFMSIDVYTGSATIKAALRFLVLTFPRPRELRYLEWCEVDFDERLIRMPAEKMKMKRPHVVPLADQVFDLLRTQREFTGHGRYVFPSPRCYTATRVMSDAALIAAMRGMGYEQDEVCAHGFRHTASTMLNESRLWTPDAIERQLAHAERNKVRGTYNQAEYLDERRRMMPWWADRVYALAAAASESRDAELRLSVNQ